MIAEVFPPVLRRRYPTEGRTVDQQDACAVARCLKKVGWARLLDDLYFGPPMTGKERKIAELEGWILGVTYLPDEREGNGKPRLRRE